MESEQKLLDDIHEGDRQAQCQLYHRYVGYAMAVALRYVPNRDDADDIIQNSFVKILSTIDRFEYRGEGSLKAWILRIVALIKQKGKFDFVEEIPEEVDVEDSDVAKIPPDVLVHMIGELPNGYRMVLNLYVFEQKSHKEIARKLGIKESTSASQYLRAKKLLAKRIKEYLNSNDYE